MIFFNFFLVYFVLLGLFLLVNTRFNNSLAFFVLTFSAFVSGITTLKSMIKMMENRSFFMILFIFELNFSGLR